MICVNKNIVPFFSIVVTCYNRAYIIERALKSILAQTCSDWECIIADDGSSDNTNEIALDYCRRDKRFRYIFHSNRKQSSTKNAGMLAASGMFVTFLDSDDEYSPDHLESRQQILFKYPDVELLHGGVEIRGDKYVPDMNKPDKMIHLKDCVIGGTFFINKYAAINIDGFPDTDYGDDTAFFDRAVENGLVIAKIDFPTYIYHRDSPDSLCNNFSKK